MAKMARIGVLGLGNWGTALALVWCNDGHNVLGWTVEQDVYESMMTVHENKKYLPGHEPRKKMQPQEPAFRVRGKLIRQSVKHILESWSYSGPFKTTFDFPIGNHSVKLFLLPLCTTDVVVNHPVAHGITQHS